MIKINKHWLILSLIVILGMAVRFNVYLQNRSLRIDEANLARNIVEKKYGDFLRPLDYQQYAPPLFLASTKCLTQVFGKNEYALKILPLLGGLLSLVLLMLICKRMIALPPARWYVLLLFAFSILAIRYGTEFKQYSTDAALALGFLLWAGKWQDRTFSFASGFLWAISGAIAIWFSMPLIFVLAAIGLAFVYKTRNQLRSNLRYLVLPGMLWLLSFGLYFKFLLYPDAATSALQAYHSPYFFDFFPTDRASLAQSLTLLESLFRLATDKTAVSIVWAILTFGAGVFYLIRKNKYQAILLLLPILFCLIASHFHFYTLIERAILFLIPLVMIVIGIGVSELWSRSNKTLKVLLIIPMLISVVNKEGYRYFRERLEMEDSKSVMRYLEEKKAGDVLIYVQHDGVPAFVFYNELHDRAWGFKNYYLANWDEKPEDIIPEKLESLADDQFWLFFAHTFLEDVERHLSSVNGFAVRTEVYESVRAAAYRFRLE